MAKEPTYKDFRGKALPQSVRVFLAGMFVTSAIGFASKILGQCNFQDVQQSLDVAPSAHGGTSITQTILALFIETDINVWLTGMAIPLAVWQIWSFVTNSSSFSVTQQTLTSMRSSAMTGLKIGLVILAVGGIAYTLDTSSHTGDSCSLSHMAYTIFYTILIGSGGVWIIVSGCQLISYKLLYDAQGRPTKNMRQIYRSVSSVVILLTVSAIAWTLYTSNFEFDSISLYSLGLLAVCAIAAVLNPSILHRRR